MELNIASNKVPIKDTNKTSSEYQFFVFFKYYEIVQQTNQNPTCHRLFLDSNRWHLHIIAIH